MEVIVFLLLITNIIAIALLTDAHKKNARLNENIQRLNENIQGLEAECDIYKWKYCQEILKIVKTPPREIPKGTVQAVKEAMKRAHPDNGGNAEDFQMYRRAYNVLTGKEKL